MDEQTLRLECLKAAVALVVAGTDGHEHRNETSLIVADYFAAYVRDGKHPKFIPYTEPDELFRNRIQFAAGHGSINQKRISTATGEALDEVGAMYDLLRVTS